MGEQDSEGRPVLGPFCSCEAPGAWMLSSWPGSPPLPAQGVSWLPWPKSRPGLQLLGNRQKRPRPLAPLEPSRREGLGVQLGQCLEGGPFPQTYSSYRPTPRGRQTLHRMQTLPGPEPRARRRGSCPPHIFPPPAQEGAGSTCARAQSHPARLERAVGPLASVDLGM